MFRKVLIANRGEITVRIMKACRELGISPVAVFSDADRESLHVQMADEAVCVGPGPAVDSYLMMDRIVEAAKKTGSEAVHPGYGFLAENPDFARLCEDSGIIFIGPTSRSMELVGDKIRSRQTMEKAGIPIIPGMKSVSENIEDYEDAARKIGYPVMIKASAGGGGKGMRIAYNADELKPGLEAGKREAKSAFGNDSVYLEKYIEEPRHVEIQILADNYGNAVHLFERECSIQRRHQKIIEESPSVALDAVLRSRMGEIALKVVKAAGYNNAGTVEFLLDKNKKFYFLEVNARLQVEHPVTEWVTGVDLVHQQINVAAGEKLPLEQNKLKQTGHAIECRIYAEDPNNGFLPSSGRILFLKEPSGPGVRFDSGIFSGCEVPIHYDPILAKLIVWAENRDKAVRRMREALNDCVILGIQTTLDFLKDVFTHPEFMKGHTTTAFIPQYFNDWKQGPGSEENSRLIALAAAYDGLRNVRIRSHGDDRQETAESPWLSLGKWRMGKG